MKKCIFILFTTLILILPSLSRAQSFDCGVGVSLSASLASSVSIVDRVGQRQIMNAAWSCTKNFFMGVWDSTGGAVGDAWDCVTSPIDCANSAATGVRNAWNFLQNLSSNLNQMWSNLQSLSAQQKVDIICELVGSLGSSVAIGILTAGAASPLVARTIAMLGAKVMKIANILRRIGGITPRKLARLSDSVLQKAEEMADLGYQRMVKNAVEACPL